MPSGDGVGLNGGKASGVINSLDADGFTIGSTINVSGRVWFWTAFGQDDAIFDWGTYSGDGSDGRNINNPGFQPDFVLVTNYAGSIIPRVWLVTKGGDNATRLGSGSWAADYIQGVSATGFQVGTSFNGSGLTYYWFCFKNSALNINQGSYSGNGADNRNITQSPNAFQSKFVVIKHESGNEGACRCDAASTDNAYRIFNADTPANIIQNQTFASGFQIGTDITVNTSGQTYHYLSVIHAEGGTPVSRTFPLQVESLASLRRSYAYPVEVLGGRARLFVLPVEFNPFVAVSRAFPLPIEIRQGQERKLPMPIEWRGDRVLERKIPTPVEWKAGLERKISIQVEWLTGSISRKFVLEIEIRGGVSRLSWIEIEWRGDNVVRRKIPMPVATLLALSRKLPIPLEWAGQGFGITHTRTILRPQRFPLTHERTIIPDAQSFSLTHTRTIRQTTGATLRHSRVILPAELIPLFTQDIHLPTGEVDKT